jgi:hypothetical protein
MIIKGFFAFDHILFLLGGHELYLTRT